MTEPSTPERAAAMHALLQSHRSIRSYDESRGLDSAFVDNVLEAALHGSSSSGNLNMVSVVKTFDRERKAHLCELHFGQPMVQQAPLVLTFCADSFRTREWLALRQARPGFADLISWHVAGFDAIILAQSAALVFESHGLGICYMGTTLHSMRAIADFLECPPHVLPVTSMVVGWPAEAPAQRDRLPPAAWIHNERYARPGADAINQHFGARDERGRQRYMDSSPEMARMWTEHGITTLAQYYTSKIKYDPDRFAEDSAALEALMRERGFLV
jgi:nitroreductase